MPYIFTCPHCQSKTQVEDRYSGETGTCYSCGTQIEIPKFATSPENAPALSKRPMGVLIAATAVLVMLICLLVAIVKFGGNSVARLADVRTRNASINNLEKIAGALNAYAADYGNYPPAATRDSSGRPLHSWRVLILPYLNENNIYDQFDLSKPWDHELNLQASYQMPAVYAHPQDANQMQGRSGYYLITGPGTLFPNSGPLAPEKIRDNQSQTILVIAGTPMIRAALGGWAQPIDYDFSVMKGQINGTTGVEPGGLMKSGVTMATMDGRGHFLPNSVSSTTFNALVTPNGNEPLPDDTLD